MMGWSAATAIRMAKRYGQTENGLLGDRTRRAPCVSLISCDVLQADSSGARV
jgi:hypothetical protein